MNIYSDNAWHTQGIQVGMDYKPGPIADAEIDTALGFEAYALGGISHRVGGGYAIGISPNYTEDYATCKEILEDLFTLPIIIKSNDGGSIGLFEKDDAIHFTVPFETDKEVYPCVLWYLVGRKSPVT